jgi:hypothetical protein
MTWVVGASSVTGHGLMASGVRISFGDGTEADLLRKSYRVGPYILAGVYGDVIPMHSLNCFTHHRVQQEANGVVPAIPQFLSP